MQSARGASRDDRRDAPAGRPAATATGRRRRRRRRCGIWPCRRSSSAGPPRPALGPPDRAVAAGSGPKLNSAGIARLRPVAVGVLERGDAVDLEVARPGAVGVHHLPRPAPVDLDDVAVALEEVDRPASRRAADPAAGRRRAPARRGAAGRRARPPRPQRATTGCSPSNAGEMEALGHHEVFAQQPVALEAGAGCAASAPRRRAAPTIDGPGDRLQPLALARRARAATATVAPNSASNSAGALRPVAEVQVEPVERQLAERPPPGAAQRHPQRRLPGRAADRRRSRRRRARCGPGGRRPPAISSGQSVTSCAVV